MFWFFLPFLVFNSLIIIFFFLLYLQNVSPWSSAGLLVFSETLRLLASYAGLPSTEPTKNRQGTQRMRKSELAPSAVLKTISDLAAHHCFVGLNVLLPLGQKRTRDVLCRVRSKLLRRRRLTHCRLLQLKFNLFHLLSLRGLSCPPPPVFLNFCANLMLILFISALLAGGPVAQGHPQ